MGGWDMSRQLTSGVLGRKKNLAVSLANKYISRVLSDGGTVQDESIVLSIYQDLIDSDEYDSCEIFYHESAGFKLTGNAIDKAYDLSKHKRDSSDHPSYKPTLDNGIVFSNSYLRVDDYFYPNVAIRMTSEITPAVTSQRAGIVFTGADNSGRGGIFIQLRDGGWRINTAIGDGSPIAITQDTATVSAAGVRQNYLVEWDGETGANMKVIFAGNTTNSTTTQGDWFDDISDRSFQIGGRLTPPFDLYNGKIHFLRINSKIL